MSAFSCAGNIAGLERPFPGDAALARLLQGRGSDPGVEDLPIVREPDQLFDVKDEGNRSAVNLQQQLALAHGGHLPRELFGSSAVAPAPSNLGD